METAITPLAPVVEKIEQIFDFIFSRIDSALSHDTAQVANAEFSIPAGSPEQFVATIQNPVTEPTINDDWGTSIVDPWRTTELHVQQSLHDHWLV